MSDEIVKLRSSVIQHGILNNRIYLMELDPGDLPGILVELDNLAVNKQYTKIFAKIPKSSKDHFRNSGYQQEACIENFFRGEEMGLFMCKYFSENRRKERNLEQIQKILLLAKNREPVDDFSHHDNKYYIDKCTEQDITEMSRLFNRVFSTYPFPVHRPEYILKTMKENIHYFCFKNRSGDIVALSSADMDFDNNNVEMTDFATKPGHRGNSFSVKLLQHMENDVADKSIFTSYTIARSLSAPMNIAFMKMGYSYGGTLTNNTNIAGHIESMNVWYKTLKSDDEQQQ